MALLPPVVRDVPPPTGAMIRPTASGRIAPIPPIVPILSDSSDSLCPTPTPSDHSDLL